MPPERTVCIISEVAGYGTKTHTLDLVAAILDRGLAVELLNCRFDIYKDIPVDWDTDRIAVATSPLGPSDKSVKFGQWRGLLRGFRGQTVILQRSSMHFGTHQFLLACLSRFESVHYIHHFPNEAPPARSPFERFKRRAKSFYAEHVIAVSEYMRSHLIDDWFYPPSKISCVPNGVHLDRFRRDAKLGSLFRDKHAIPADTVTFGVLARFHYEKGVDLAIRAFGELLKFEGCGKTRLVLVGDGPDRGMIEDLVKSLGMCDKVVFCGFMADPRPALYGVDILVAPSRKEASGLSVLEGIAAGCVPMVFAVGGLPEIVTGRGDGWLAHAGDVRALAQAMKDGVERTESERSAMQRNAYNRVQDLFNARTNYPKLLDTLGL